MSQKDLKTKKVEWATIGGRIEEYKNLAIEYGIEFAKLKIFDDYGYENGPLVFNGLIIYMEYGSEKYYQGLLDGGQND